MSDIGDTQGVTDSSRLIPWYGWIDPARPIVDAAVHRGHRGIAESTRQRCRYLLTPYAVMTEDNQQFVAI
jgi:hypothetical protein